MTTPTNNAVPSNNPNDLLFNVEKLDEVVSGTGQYYTDRLGVNRRTLAGIDASADNVLNSIGYEVPVGYADGISLTTTSQTVEYNGVVYAPKSSALPFTTGGTFETAKFRAIQVTDAQYLNYTPAGTGAVDTTVQSKLRELVSVKDFKCADGLPVQGDGVHDDTTGIQAAIDYALSKYVRVVNSSGGTFPAVMVKVVFPPGVYKTSGTLTTNTGSYATCVLDGQGQACIYYTGVGKAIYLRPIDPGLPLMTTPSQIRNLTFRGAGTKQGTAIYLETMTNGTVYNCNIYNFDVGIRISGAEAYDIDLGQQAIDTCNYGIIIEQSANQIRPNLCVIRNAYFINCSDKSVWIRNNEVGSGASGGVLSIRDVNFQGGSTIALHVDTPGEIAGDGTVSVERCWFEGYGSKAVFLRNGRITFNNCFFTNNGTSAADTMIYLDDTVSKMDFYYCSFHAGVTPANNCHISIKEPTVNYTYLQKNVETKKLKLNVDGIAGVHVGYNNTIGIDNSVSNTLLSSLMQTAYGTTGNLTASGFQDVYDLSSAGGGQFMVTAWQADGGRVWRGFWVLSSDGGAVNSVTSIQAQFITVSVSSAQLRITNSHPTESIALAWSILRIG